MSAGVYQRATFVRQGDDIPAGFPAHVHRRVVVASDSDFLAYGTISNVLHVLPHSRKFGMYTLSDVLSAFQFKSPLQLITLRCVSDSEYGKIVLGFGVKSNVGIIRNLEPNDVCSMVDAYCDVIRKRTSVAVGRTHFQSRIRVFHHQTDSVIDSQRSEIRSAEPLPASSFPLLDMSMDELSTESQLHTIDLSSLGTLQQVLHPRLDPVLEPLKNAKAQQQELRRTSKADNR